MNENQVAHIRYTKATNAGSSHAGEVSERYILPTYIPSDNIRAFDVTSHSESEIKRLQELWEEYQKYYQTALQTIFSFEDWVVHTTGDVDDIRSLALWRTFKHNNTEVLE